MSTITITFADGVENSKGMQIIGNRTDDGFSVADLKLAKEKFESAGYACELITFPPFEDQAAVLVVRNGCGITHESKDSVAVFSELNALKWDKKAYSRGRVVNKIARFNLCFADAPQEADYENKKGTVIPFEQVPPLDSLRRALPQYLGAKAEKLLAEGNNYYDTSKCYIGWHGDTERSIVVGARFGAQLPLNFQWFQRSAPLANSPVTSILIQGGDLYAMSSKAVGNDWLSKIKPTLRHSAGNIEMKQLSLLGKRKPSI